MSMQIILNIGSPDANNDVRSAKICHLPKAITHHNRWPIIILVDHNRNLNFSKLLCKIQRLHSFQLGPK